jgi:hypothetical protein
MLAQPELPTRRQGARIEISVRAMIARNRLPQIIDPPGFNRLIGLLRLVTLA